MNAQLKPNPEYWPARRQFSNTEPTFLPHTQGSPNDAGLIDFGADFAPKDLHIGRTFKQPTPKREPLFAGSKWASRAIGAALVIAYLAVMVISLPGAGK